MRCLWWAAWLNLKFDDSSPEWGGILTDPPGRFLWSALAAAGGLTTIKNARMRSTTFASGFMNNYALLTDDLAHRGKEMAKGFLLTIRADDGSTMLQTNVDYIHQAFQRLIDWSIDEVNNDVCAVISGPNGFYANHRIKASPDFTWIEEEKASSEAFA